MRFHAHRGGGYRHAGMRHGRFAHHGARYRRGHAARVHSRHYRVRQAQRNQLRMERRAQNRQDARRSHVDRQQATRGRFASQFHDRRGNRADRRTAHLAGRDAWRHNWRARHVAWLGAVYWPYVYSDVFYYSFWPYAYDTGYWAYAYDDFFDSIFFPYGAPYVGYAYQGPYQSAYARRGSGLRGSDVAAVPGRVSEQAREICAAPGQGVTAWPFERIEAAVQPSAEQKDLLEQLRQAAAKAADRLKEACPEDLPMTPAGRLQAMTTRLQATLDAVKLVRPPLAAFYEKLTDEQKARFNEIGPSVGRDEQRTTRRQPPPEASCNSARAGLSTLAADRIESVVQPTDAQQTAFDRLNQAMDSAVAKLQSACPTTIALTPVGRLETMQQRLEAMIEAANTVRPALDNFYAQLSDEQKAKFNRLGRDSARSAR